MCWLALSSRRENLNWNTYIKNNMCCLVLQADPTDAESSPSLFPCRRRMHISHSQSLNLLVKVFLLDTAEEMIRALLHWDLVYLFPGKKIKTILILNPGSANRTGLGLHSTFGCF